MELVDIVYHKLIWDPSPFARLSSGIFWRAAPNRVGGREGLVGPILVLLGTRPNGEGLG